LVLSVQTYSYPHM